MAELALALTLPLGLLSFLVLPPVRAALLVYLGGSLFLPEVVAFDAPLLPPLGKRELAVITALLGLVLFQRSRVRAARPGRGLDVLVLILVAGSVATAFSNREALENAGWVRQGLTFHDAISMAVQEILQVGCPLLLGRAVIARRRDLELLNRTIIGFGLVYSLLALFEVRFSPQLHRLIYGFHAHEFSQTLRWGGYRPTVFMAHGLAVGLFMLAVVLAAAGRWRVKRVTFLVPTVAVFVWLLFVFASCKSTGAMVLAALVLPFAARVRPSGAWRLAAFAGALCLVYPFLKTSGTFPDDALVSGARAISAERAESLAFRFENDAMLVEHARTKLWFGWGGYSRSHVVDQWGRDLSTVDGYWIVRLGANGIVGALASFLILTLPLLTGGRRVRPLEDRDTKHLLANLALLLVVHAVDLLPNGLFTCVPFFLAGALDGALRVLPRQESEESEESENLEAQVAEHDEDGRARVG